MTHASTRSDRGDQTLASIS
ncbi:protein of unknown function [Methanoculleus bourgensis]|uniref:Uncharacterized protein n=1 Tax=Methanoculleus bourgensis TaxID=83986 RepID=A0A120N6U1_9EURY|nr:protein of unknown function [Methanoculleus bourgensis]